ncbi:c-type cytochrome [Aquimarina sp. RZ0]|uniref:cytochrome c/ABC transporter substrate-binding protein n=1 Tax=Aquimarina sp. RZ0 TaxID=2607730 RepID=UPI0011F1019B|nr:c-type cytochrome [Aquimarina sp. RZ0]KAA1246573.1 ABC transporter substrate-binding protein [Aquimarina sp. RZ0]
MKKKLLSYLFFLFFVCTAAKKTTVSRIDQELTYQQKIGKRIYTKGIGGTNIKIMAEMSGVQVPATIMPCVNCHRADGRGNPEGGIVPSNITWAELTKSYGGERLDSQKRPPYTKQSLRKVITTGIDPAGNHLNTAMPKYNMSMEDINNLIEYIKILDSDKDAGLTNSRIELGIVLPEKRTTAYNKNSTVKKLVNAYCMAINSTGGIYNRNIIPHFFEVDELQNKQDFFMILGFNDKRITENIKHKNIPTLLSFSSKKASKGLQNPYTFYTYPSLTAQSLSLVDFSKQKKIAKKGTKATILYYNDPIRKEIAEEIAKYYFKHFKKHPNAISITSENIIENVKNAQIQSNEPIYFIGPSGLGNQLLLTLDNLNKSAYVLIPGSLSGIDIFTMPETFKDKVFIGYPTWISEQTNEGLQAYEELAKNYNLDHKWRRDQLDMLSMLFTTEECLKRIGRNLSRDKFIKTMENFFEYSNGISPSITYNLNKRVGNSNVYIIGFDTAEKKMELITTVHSKEQ